MTPDELSVELPRYVKTLQAIYYDASVFWHDHLAWFGGTSESAKGPGLETEQLRSMAAWIVNAATDALKDALVVGFYLLFLLLEVHNYPLRIRTGFPGERAADFPRFCQRTWPLTGLFSSCLLLTICGLNTMRVRSPGRRTIASTTAESGPV